MTLYLDRPRKSSVYVVHAERWVKIGISDNPRRRLADLTNACPVPPALVYHTELFDYFVALTIERRAHANFREKRTNGEWFELTPAEAIGAIKEILGRSEPVCRMEGDNGAEVAVHMWNDITSMQDLSRGVRRYVCACCGECTTENGT